MFFLTHTETGERYKKNCGVELHFVISPRESKDISLKLLFHSRNDEILTEIKYDKSYISNNRFASRGIDTDSLAEIKNRDEILFDGYMNYADMEKYISDMIKKQ